MIQPHFSRGTRRGSVDGINTHCGFIEPTGCDMTQEQIGHKCDRFMERRYGLIWVGDKQDYLPKASQPKQIGFAGLVEIAKASLKAAAI